MYHTGMTSSNIYLYLYTFLVMHLIRYFSYEYILAKLVTNIEIATITFYTKITITVLSDTKFSYSQVT